MHFIDFVLQLVCFVCWALKLIYIFSFDYVIPVIGHVLPVLTKYLSKLFSLLLRIFFTYISPCITQLLMGTTYVFTRALNAMSGATMTIIDSDVNLEYAHALLMVSLLVVFVYFHISQKIARFCYGWYQMITLYLRVLLNVMKMLRFCFNFIYRKVAALVFNKQTNPDDETPNSKTLKLHHKSHQNGVNGSAHKLSLSKQE